MKRPKYHFLRCGQNGRGKSIFTLPGQTFGQIPVPSGILVKDVRGNSAVARARKTASIGDIFFTTTLKHERYKLTVKDIHALDRQVDAVFSDVFDLYEKYKEKQSAPDK